VFNILFYHNNSSKEINNNFNMTEPKRSVEFIANNTKEALDMKKSLEDKGFDVNHVYTGCSVSTLIDDNKNYTTGAGNIRANYLTSKK